MDDGSSCRYHFIQVLATIETYPGYETQVRYLVEQHKKMKKPHLRLAVYFAPPRRAKHDIYLFEVIDGFGGDAVDPEKKLFEFGYGPTRVFPMPPEATLRMVLTNPAEFDVAVRHSWKGIEDLRAACKVGRASVIYSDAKGKKLWDLIK